MNNEPDEPTIAERVAAFRVELTLMGVRPSTCAWVADSYKSRLLVETESKKAEAYRQTYLALCRNLKDDFRYK